MVLVYIGHLSTVRQLTDNVELHKVAHLGLSADLALIDAGVARLHVLHLQHGDDSLSILILRRGRIRISRSADVHTCSVHVSVASTRKAWKRSSAMKVNRSTVSMCASRRRIHDTDLLLSCRTCTDKDNLNHPKLIQNTFSTN